MRSMKGTLAGLLVIAAAAAVPSGAMAFESVEHTTIGTPDEGGPNINVFAVSKYSDASTP
jgi:hypothetical protein